jgi:hypothetical protein
MFAANISEQAQIAQTITRYSLEYWVARAKRCGIEVNLAALEQARQEIDLRQGDVRNYWHSQVDKSRGDKRQTDKEQAA